MKMTLIIHLAMVISLSLVLWKFWDKLQDTKKEFDSIKDEFSQLRIRVGNLSLENQQWKTNMQGNFTEMRCYLDMRLDGLKPKCRQKTSQRSQKALSLHRIKNPSGRKDLRK